MRFAITTLTVSLLSAALVVHAAEPIQHAPYKTELLPLNSVTASDRDVLRGDLSAGRSVTLGTELSLPLEATGRVPAVVLLHGSAGVFPYVTEWREELARMGYASLIVDSFSARGIASTISDQDKLGRLNALVDAYRALSMLRSHPRIDGRRIVLMGFSRGADSTLYAALTRFRTAYGQGGGFAGHIAFYPNCGTRYRGDTDVPTGVPLLMLHGSADDYAPPQPCRAYFGRLKEAGVDVQRTEFEGARHVFMWRDLDEDDELKTGQTTRACRLEERDDGVVVNVDTQKPFSHQDACVQRGPHVGYNERAATQSRQLVAQFLAKLLEVPR